MSMLPQCGPIRLACFSSEWNVLRKSAQPLHQTSLASTFLQPYVLLSHPLRPLFPVSRERGSGPFHNQVVQCHTLLYRPRIKHTQSRKSEPFQSGPIISSWRVLRKSAWALHKESLEGTLLPAAQHHTSPDRPCLIGKPTGTYRVPDIGCWLKVAISPHPALHTGYIS